MSIPGGIRVKLALALLVIVGGALGVAYAIVVPQLESRLIEAKLDELERTANTLALGYVRNEASFSPLERDDWVREAAETFNTRVVVFDAYEPPLYLATQADSSLGTGLESDRVARRTARTNRITRDVLTRRGRRYAEVAIPVSLFGSRVMLLSASLDDQISTVRRIERRLLYATGAALVVALGLGALAAGVHARRIMRLERAADRIAKGRFDEPVVDTGKDELGALAAAFDRMRVQIAQLDTARKEFVANASHELRTPLFSLGGFLELLADEDLDEQTRRGFLATMREQVDRLTKLATDLLDLSRMDAGRLHIEQEEVDLAEMGRILGDELHGLAEAKAHSLGLELEEGVWALADEERVLQVARALAGNALVHTPAGTDVVVRAHNAGGRAILAVEDDGPGISAEHLDSIFERFYRIEGGHASGSGLGLAIARELGERMGGEVRVESRPGRTVFSLLLPAASVPERAPELVRA